MFAPAPAAGEEATSSTAGSRMLPSTSPTAPPATATVKHQAQKRVSSSASTAAQSDRRAVVNGAPPYGMCAQCMATAATATAAATGVAPGAARSPAW